MYAVDGEIYCDSCFESSLTPEEWEYAYDDSHCIDGPTDSFVRCANCGSLEGRYLTDEGWRYEASGLADNLIRNPEGVKDLLSETNLRYWTEVEGGCWSCPGATWGDVVDEVIDELRECHNLPLGMDEVGEVLFNLGEAVSSGDPMDIYIMATLLRGLLD